MPIQALQVAHFNAGAYITIEGEGDSDRFFIIKEGNVRIFESIDPIVGRGKEGVRLGPGDFFGVVSCMSGRPRTETSIAETNVSLLVVSKESFSLLVQVHPAIALKILRFFSKELREYDKTLTKLVFKSSVEEDPSNLFKIAEYYYSKKMYLQSAYAYKKYIELVPDGAFVPQAKERLSQIDPEIVVSTEPEVEGFYKHYKDGQIIFCEHELGDEVYVIRKGQVKIVKMVEDKEVLLAILKEGDIFGEMAILENKPRSATAIASGDTTLMFIRKENFELAVKEDPNIATKIIELLSNRIWAIYRHLANIVLREPNARFYDAILIHIEKERLQPDRKTPYHSNLTVDDLIKFLGWDPKEGKRIIREILLTDKNIEINEEGKIVVKDTQELYTRVIALKKKLLLELKARIARENR